MTVEESSIVEAVYNRVLGRLKIIYMENGSMASSIIRAPFIVNSMSLHIIFARDFSIIQFDGVPMQIFNILFI